MYGLGNLEVVDLAQLNIETNKCDDHASAQELKWGSMNAIDFYETANLIIGSDLTYNSGSWKLLAETVAVILKPGGLFLYLTLGHSGFSVAGEIEGFLAVAAGEGLKLVQQGSGDWPFNKFSSFTSLLESQLNQNEKEIIKSTGGVRVVLLKNSF